jgi:hypothetical protein
VDIKEERTPDGETTHGLREHLNRFFKSEKAWHLKVAAAGGVGLGLAGWANWKQRNSTTAYEQNSLLIMAPVVVMLIA